MRFIGKLALAAALVAALPAATASAAAQPLAADSGTFAIFVNGNEAGNEAFEIRTAAGAAGEVLSVSRAQLAAGQIIDTRLRVTGPDAVPSQYQMTLGGGGPMRIVATGGGGRFSAKIVTASGEQLREYVASAGAVVLDEGVVHHYQLLAARTRNGRVPILVPRQSRQVMATVSNRGEEEVEIGGRRVTLSHLVVEPQGGDERHVWIDRAGRVMRLVIPARSLSAERR
jgi:hypothetical protein